MESCQVQSHDKTRNVGDISGSLGDYLPVDVGLWAVDLDLTLNQYPTEIPTTSTQDSSLHRVSDKDLIIAVMGPTGSGKSEFIAIATGHGLPIVGHKLASFTSEVRAFSCSHRDGSQRNVVFVDTPGFDDTFKSDTQILQAIADWLVATYRQKITLSGVLYLHRISQNRMAGTPHRNLSMFQNLCGNDALRNVILVTTMWDEVAGTIGLERENQLRREYWSTMISAGARVDRFRRTYDSAWDIISCFSGGGRALQLQREIVEEGKTFAETAAGFALLQFLTRIRSQIRELIKRLEKYLRGIPKHDNSSDAAAVLQETTSQSRDLEQVHDQITRLMDPARGLPRRRLSTIRSIASRSSRNPSPTPSRRSENPSSQPPLPLERPRNLSCSTAVASILNQRARPSPLISLRSRISSPPMSTRISSTQSECDT